MTDRTYEELAEQAVVKAAASEPFEVTRAEYQTLCAEPKQDGMEQDIRLAGHPPTFLGATLHVKQARFRLQGG